MGKTGEPGKGAQLALTWWHATGDKRMCISHMSEPRKVKLSHRTAGPFCGVRLGREGGGGSYVGKG